MELNKFSYLRRFNLGNYEHEELTLEVSFDQGIKIEAIDAEIKQVRKIVNSNSTEFLKKEMSKTLTKKQGE